MFDSSSFGISKLVAYFMLLLFYLLVTDSFHQHSTMSWNLGA